ncbi:MAG: hypothetical protein H6Q60_193 [Oscillospiraceae bacterium]|nr:hypothetical protein [Oscillospiraceae bacterium]
MIMESKGLIIYPKQPYFVMATEHYYKAVVMNYGISHFYCFLKDKTTEHPVIAVPDGCIDILFCCDESEPFAHICGTVLQPTVVMNEPGKYYFGVRFLPGHTFRTNDFTMSDFVEQEIPFLQVIDDRELFNLITSSRDFSEQIKHFMEHYLPQQRQMAALDQHKELKSFLMSKVLKSAGQIRVKELAESSGYSVRYINKIFSQEFGLSPKGFCKLMRFQHLINNLNEQNPELFDQDLAQLAAELGYYDQSHMIRDFYELANTTPGKYIHTLQETDYKKRIIMI